MSAQNPSQPSGGSLVPRPDTALDHVLALARPPLLPGENEAHFTALASQLVAAAKPKDTIEEILVRDVIDLTWEIQRLRRAKAGLLTVSMGDGLEQVLAAIGHGGHLDRKTLSRNWMTGQKQAQQTVRKALFEAGLSLDEVTASTLEIKLDSVERLDRMLASAEARRNNSLREIDRHREALGAGMRKGIEEVQDVEFTDLETGAVHAPAD